MRRASTRARAIQEKLKDEFLFSSGKIGDDSARALERFTIKKLADLQARFERLQKQIKRPKQR